MASKNAGLLTPGQAALPASVVPHFKDMFKYYEEKLFKFALKAADAVLKKVPEHAETLAMRALILSSMGKREEAHKDAKAALKLDIKSHVCWHVYGCLHRTDKNYSEAVKCFRAAHKSDPENLQVLRDLATLQVHMRDYRGHCESRRLLLTLRSTVPTHWTGFAVAHALTGNYDMAVAVLEQYQSTLDPLRSATYENSELVLFKVRLCEQMGDTERALGILAREEAHVVDKRTLAEKRAQLQLITGRVDEALTAFRSLLGVNPEHYGFHRGFQLALLAKYAPAVLTAPVSADNFLLTGCALPSNDAALLPRMSQREVALLLAAYTGLAADAPRARAPRRIPLDLLSAEHAAFRPLLAAYVRGSLRKGIPSLFTDLKQMLRAPADAGLGWAARQALHVAQGRAGAPTAKAVVLTSLLADFDAAISSGAALPAPDTPADMWHSTVVAPLGDDAPAILERVTGGAAAPAFAQLSRSAGDGNLELPTLVPWLALLRARVCDELGDSAGALAHVDAAVRHSPTVIDVYLAKARAQKHTGALWAAADTADYARSLDLADRYLNNKAVKYLLRADRITQANRTLALFTRHDSRDTTGDPLGNATSMQVMWYELEAGAAHERTGNLGLALKHFLRVEKHFQEYVEDQMDFHGYSLRKGPLRSYTELLAVEDRMPGHAYYLQAMLGATRCYMALAADAAPAAHGTARWDADATASALASGEPGAVSSVAAARLALAQSHTAYARASAASIAAFAATKTSKAGEEGAGVEKDDDPCGDKLVAGVTPSAALEAASKHMASVLSGLPAYAVPDVAVARTVDAHTSGKMETPTRATGLRAPSALASGALAGWNITPDFICEAYALGALLALETGKTLAAVAYMRAGSRAAVDSAAASYFGAAQATAGLPPAMLHPSLALATLCVCSSVEAELAAGSASPVAAAAPTLAAVLAHADCVGDVTPVAARAARVFSALTPMSVEHAVCQALFGIAAAGGRRLLPACLPALYLSAPDALTRGVPTATLRAPLDAALEAAGAALRTVSSRPGSAVSHTACAQLVALAHVAQHAGVLSSSQVEHVMRAVAAASPAADCANEAPTVVAPELETPTTPATSGAGASADASAAAGSAPA